MFRLSNWSASSALGRAYPDLSLFEIQDAASEALERYFLSDYSSIQNPKAWVFQVASHILEHAKHERERFGKIEEASHCGAIPDDPERITIEELNYLLFGARLTTMERNTIRLLDFGFSYADLEALHEEHIPQERWRQWASRGRRKIKKFLEAEDNRHRDEKNMMKNSNVLSQTGPHNLL